MVKQLDCPTCFMANSSANVRWNELLSTIIKLNNLGLSENDIEKAPYEMLCAIWYH